MALWAIIPIKSLKDGKTRLAGILSESERAALNRSMLMNLLKTVKDCEKITGVLIVSHDPEIEALAKSYSLEYLEESPPYSLNQAVAKGCQYAESLGATEVLILPADLPLINTESIQSILEKDDDPPIAVIAPDRRGEGTNSLLLNPFENFPFQFGTNSYEIHQKIAISRKFQVKTVIEPGMELDLDLPEDWDYYQEKIHPQKIIIGG